MRPDRFTRGLRGLEPGEEVVLADERGTGLASAWADPDDEVCARVYDPRPGRRFDPDAAFAAAWTRRAALHDDPHTTCYRLIHGEADGWPALRAERYGDAVVVVSFADAALPWIDALCTRIAARLPRATIAVRDHRDDLRRRDVATRAWRGALPPPETVVEGLELGVRVPVQPFAGLATGIYVDQRATRAWLRRRAAGARVLNLFAYTGLFSVSLLAAGAAAALDVDLSAPALRRGAEMAARNGVGDRLAQRQGDALATVRALDQAFDIAVVDPPTAAQGAGGWIARRDYPALLAATLPRLAPGGLLVACLNTAGGRTPDLAAWVDAAATTAGVAVQRVAVPDPEPDVPLRRGFPEGRPFRAVAVVRR